MYNGNEARNWAYDFVSLTNHMIDEYVKSNNNIKLSETQKKNGNIGTIE